MQIRVVRSTRKEKKLMARVGDEAFHFGARGYDDYTTHKDPARKAQYLARHRTNEDWSISGLRSAGFWARHILWSEPTLQASVSALNKSFPSIKVFIHGT